MRTYTPEFSFLDRQANREPIAVVEISFDSDNTDIHYLTSHTVLGLTGNIINDTLTVVSSTSQKIDYEKALSTIGSISFSCLDTGITELQRTKLTAGDGLRGKRVRVYKGYKDLPWAQYERVQTQIISETISYKDGVYTFKCSDIQRELRQGIFEPKKTVLTASISATDTSIPALDTNGFETVYQVPSAQGLTLLRGLQQRGNNPELNGVDKIGLIKIEAGGEFEIAIWQSKTLFSFDNLTRGVLGTKPLDVELSSGATDQNAPKITEYVYIEMPAIKAAYAIQTGSIYGVPGETLPTHWHRGISTDYISTSSFISIGSDIWDINDDDAGFPVVIKNPGEQDAKKFLETKLYFMCGVYSPVLSTGELSLKRLKQIGPKGAYDRLLNESSITQYSNLEHDLKSVINTYVIRWNWDEREEVFSRTSVVFSPESISKHGEADPKTIELETLSGSRHSDYLINYFFSALRTRYANPPLLLTLTLTPDQSDLEVGDIVRVQLPQIEDFSNEASETLNRNFEIQSISHDWVKGTIKVTLFGTSLRASEVLPDFTDGIDSAFISVAGTEINATNFPGQVSSAGGITTVTGTINLTGASSLNDNACIYYCNEDLTIDASGTVNIDTNVQIRVDGFFQINGKIDGKGTGVSGGVADSVAANVVSPVTANLGTQGIGITSAQGGWEKTSFTVNVGNNENFPRTTTFWRNAAGSQENRVVRGLFDSVPNPLLKLDENYNVIGLPDVLYGTSGSSGGGVYSNTTVLAQGGNGGSSGAGLAIFSRGLDLGAAGVIDLSGDDGLEGQDDTSLFFDRYPFDPVNDVMRAGAGAGGAAGGLLLCMLDSTQTFPVINDSNFVFNYGVCPEAFTFWDYVETVDYSGSVNLLRWGDAPNGTWGLPASNPAGGGGLMKETENAFEVHTQIAFLDTRSTSKADDSPFVESDPDFTLTEVRNTPPTPEANQSTIEVSITPPTDDNYYYSNVEYRKVGVEGWTSIGAAAPEGLIQVPSDGATYEVRVLAVSVDQVQSTSGIVKSITVTDINGRTDVELSSDYPFDALTVVLDSSSGAFADEGAGFSWGDTNREKSYFSHYLVEIHEATDGLLRSENVNDPSFVYSLRANAEDYFTQNGSNGAYAEIEIRVYPVAVFRNGSNEFYKGSVSSLTATAINIPTPVPVVSYTEVGEALLSWPENSSEYYTTTYLLEYDGSIVTQTTDNQIIIPIDWIGARNFEFYASPIAGQLSSSETVSIAPTSPGRPTVTYRVIDNNVLFNYESVKGSLPINRYEIRKSGTYNVGDTPIAIKAGTSTFTVIAESVSGTFTYWFDAVDIAGNRSTTRQVSAIVNEPPDFNFVDSYSALENDWPGTLTNCLVDTQDRLILPVNTTDTWAQHFTNNSWDQPQDQIDAGYEYYLQPSTNTATYAFTWDTGAVISSTMITVSPAPTVLDGSVTQSTEIEYSDDNVSFTSGGAGVEQVLATNFRYVRVTITFSASGGDDLAYLNDVIVRLDAKIARDSGKGTANAGDAGGTTFTFNKNFVDAEPPRISIVSTSALTATVDFVDAPNPTSFDVYVWDSSGNRATADISWETSGFLGAS